jgi:hypothetical protein
MLLATENNEEMTKKDRVSYYTEKLELYEKKPHTPRTRYFLKSTRDFFSFIHIFNGVF